MDEVNIRSGLMQGAIAEALEKLVSQKTGFRPQIQFRDPIQIRYDGDKASIHLSVDAELGRKDLEELLQKLI